MPTKINKHLSPSAPTARILNGPTNLSDICLGILLQAARKYLFADVKIKVVAYLIIVLVLSIISDYVKLPETFYFVQVSLLKN